MISLNKYTMVLGVVIMFSGVVKADSEKTSELMQKIEKCKQLFHEATRQENIDWLNNNKDVAASQIKKVFTQYPMHIPAISLIGAGMFASKLGNADHLSKEDLLKRLKNKGTRNFWMGIALLTGHVLYNYEFSIKTPKSFSHEKE